VSIQTFFLTNEDLYEYIPILKFQACFIQKTVFRQARSGGIEEPCIPAPGGSGNLRL